MTKCPRCRAGRPCVEHDAEPFPGLETEKEQQMEEPVRADEIEAKPDPEAQKQQAARAVAERRVSGQQRVESVSDQAADERARRTDDLDLWMSKQRPGPNR